MSMNGPSVLFLFAHQDDEFGVFGEIQRLVCRGERVSIAYLTSGDLSGKPSPIRDEESIAVLGKLGVSRQNIHFLGRETEIPDGKLFAYLDTAFQAVLNLAERIGRPQRLYFLAWEGGHQDHDAVHLVGLATGRQLRIIDKCFQFPLYTGAGLPSVFYKLFSPIPENGRPGVFTIPWRKRIEYIRYCFSYPSQKKTWLGLFPFFLFHYIFWGTQILQPVSLPRIRQSPHAGKLLYERRGFCRYQDFIQHANIFLDRFLPTSAKENE